MHWTPQAWSTHPLRMVSIGERTPARRRVRVPSVQLKFVMAVSGVIMLLFLVAHMVGNLKIFLGAEAIDTYAAWLRTIGEPAVPAETVLWLLRVVLLVALVGHVGSAIVLARRARTARPVKYVHHQKVHGSYAARTTRWGGVIIALFLIWHILDLTTGTVNPNGVHLAVHDNIVADFAPSRWYITLVYALAVVAVGFHIRHGIWSALQSLGRSSVSSQRTIQGVALAVAIVLTVGFLAVPFSVLFGWVG